jgi:chromosome segregation ATPase
MINLKIHTHKEFSALKADKDSLAAKCKGLEAEIETLKNASKETTDMQAKFNADIEKSKADMTALVNTHNATVKTLTDTHTKAIDDINTQYSAAIDTMKAEYEKQISDLKAEVKKAETSSEAKAISTLSKIGVPMEDIPSAKVSVAVTPHLDAMTKMAGAELSNYLEQNKLAIFAEMKAKKANKGKI